MVPFALKHGDFKKWGKRRLSSSLGVRDVGGGGYRDRGTGEEAESLVAVAAEEGHGMVAGKEGDEVGDFYEAIGIGACNLVEYAGLNPFGGLRSDSIARASRPVMVRIFL
ncbi:hypothetical protein ACH5RR_003634 [Cinchona calisaya]|uniref:Uncharacterized protein n=1 Tax=Cinchona calisaya TaxID=153742 RepID=A0ABD3AVU0_9GENT